MTSFCYDSAMDRNEQRKQRSREGAPEPVELSLAELSERAGVTARTVRYYIAEGLLPPPVAAGPQSSYTQGHLDRLRLIARLKDAYLPLREIRRRLAGLDDAAVRALLARDEVAAPARMESAREYLDHVLGAPRPEPPRGDRGRHPGLGAPSLREASSEAEPRFAAVAEPAASYPARPSPLTVGATTPLLPHLPAPAEEADSESWRRVRLGEDAELLIRESAYRQQQDRIDWLLRWARRVFRQ